MATTNADMRRYEANAILRDHFGYTPTAGDSAGLINDTTIDPEVREAACLRYYGEGQDEFVA